MIKNAYIHIPFCASKCYYCSFISFCDLSLKKTYLDALESQIKSEYLDAKSIGVNEPLKTLYFGGGTPSLLTIHEFKRLIDLFKLESDAEITVEVNPDSVDFEYLSALRALGVNRISIGVQAFDDNILNEIGRRHDSKQAISTIDTAQGVGFTNVSVDLIYGLPNQTLSGFENDLKTAINSNIQHVSLYGLKIESDSYFGKNKPRNLPDLDLQADMYLKAVEILTVNGFEHYEISNFSRVGFNSRHNLNYWENNTYYGFGCAASGYYNCPLTPTLSPQWGVSIRYQNEPDLKKYITNPTSKISQEKLTEQEILEEAIFLGFRKTEGIETEKLNSQFKIDFDTKYEKILKKYAKFFNKTQKGWALNLKGIMISNEILAEFID